MRGALRRHNPRLRIGFNPRRRRFEMLYLLSQGGQPFPEPPALYPDKLEGLKHPSLEFRFACVRDDGSPRAPAWCDYHRIRAMDTVNMTPAQLCREIEDHNTGVDLAADKKVDVHLAEIAEYAWRLRTGSVQRGYEPAGARWW